MNPRLGLAIRFLDAAMDSLSLDAFLDKEVSALHWLNRKRRYGSKSVKVRVNRVCVELAPTEAKEVIQLNLLLKRGFTDKRRK